MKKICSSCKRSLPESAFGAYAWKNKGSPCCKECKAAYNQRWYLDNKVKHMADVERNRAVYIKRFQSWLTAEKSKPCMDCGGNFPIVCMDFDHREGEEKLYSVAHMRAHSVDALIAEIQKCDLVCANCHRIRTTDRFRLASGLG